MKILKLIGLMLLTANLLVAQNYSAPGAVSGDQNTVVGVEAGINTSIGSQNTAIGFKAFKSGTGNGNTNIGWQAGWNITGNQNTFIGRKAGYNAQSGNGNVAIGNESLLNNNGGTNNLAIGSSAGFSNINGGSNIFMGTFAGNGNTSGTGNTYIGTSAGVGNNGNSNIAIGTNAGRVEDTTSLGAYNVFIGVNAGYGLLDEREKLYIQSQSPNSDNTIPLIYGDFASKQVGIGTIHVPTDPDTNIPYTLAVAGKTLTEEVQVMMRDTWWPDYVFAEDYKLMSLTDLETEIEALGHLPGVPSAEEVETNGHALGRMDAILLEKVEELTLHLIDMNKEIKDLRKENNTLKNEIKVLKK